MLIIFEKMYYSNVGNYYTHLMASLQDNLGKPVPER